MNVQDLSTMKGCVPLILLAFVLCGVGSWYCPMSASATDIHHSQPTSHHSSSSQTTGDCPDQFITSAGFFEKENVSVGILPAASVSWFHDIPSFSQFKFPWDARTPSSTTYPLLFLLFSVFLN